MTCKISIKIIPLLLSSSGYERKDKGVGFNQLTGDGHRRKAGFYQSVKYVQIILIQVVRVTELATVK